MEADDEVASAATVEIFSTTMDVSVGIVAPGIEAELAVVSASGDVEVLDVEAA